MKILILLTILSFYANAEVINVKKIGIFPGFDVKFKLHDTVKHKSFAVLDCQSFFKKFDIYDKSNQRTEEYILTERECYQMYKNTVQCLKSSGSKCIDSKSPFDKSCNCTYR